MEYWFYHLESSTVEGVLPELLKKTLSKGWKALVKLPSENLTAMDEFLWTFQEGSFLPHGCDTEPLADQQPILLSASAETAKGYEAVFMIGATDIKDLSGVERCMIMINGRSASEIAKERARWKQLKGENATLSYYQQNDRGGWNKKA